MIKGATSCANTWTHRLGGNFGLDVPDLDLPSKRGRIVSKGGTTDWVHWQTGTAMLLPRLLAGRRQGPVFLIARKPARAAASGDLCPVTLRARLSYRRTAESFELATRPLANPGATAGELEELHGWTLHQLRHSLLTHEAEDGTSTPMLLARSRHASVRSSSATRAPGLRPSPATSHAPTRPRGAASPNAKRSARNRQPAAQKSLPCRTAGVCAPQRRGPITPRAQEHRVVELLPSVHRAPARGSLRPRDQNCQSGVS